MYLQGCGQTRRDSPKAIPIQSQVDESPQGLESGREQVPIMELVSFELQGEQFGKACEEEGQGGKETL